jgi:hypothetical protein
MAKRNAENRWHRREWLTMAASVFVVGCNRKRPAMNASQVRRAEHVTSLTRVDAMAKFTTSKPPVDLTARFPEFKALAKITHRLHPRYGDEPGPHESKLGGQFLWPIDEPWPAGMHPVLQVRLDDAPPQCPFMPGTDLLQLLWTADEKLLRAVVAWRKSESVTGTLHAISLNEQSNFDRIPVPCRLHPERVVEWPSLGVLPAHGRDTLRTIAEYETQLSAAPGTKIGGYGFQLTATEIPACTTCRRGMDFLLTVSPHEWTHPRWRPAEETDDRHRRDIGLSFDEARGCHVFVCRRCPLWPIATRLA